MHPVENVFQRDGTVLRGLTKDLKAHFLIINCDSVANRVFIKNAFYTSPNGIVKDLEAFVKQYNDSNHNKHSLSCIAR